MEEEIKRNELKMGFSKRKPASYDEESEADSGIADSVESPTAKGKKNIWTHSTRTKNQLTDASTYDDVFKKPKTTKTITITTLKDSVNINNAENFRKPIKHVGQYTKDQERGTVNVVLSSATLADEQREGKYEKKYNSAACLHHRSAVKKNRIKRSVMAMRTNGECRVDANVCNNRGQISNNNYNNSEIQNLSSSNNGSVNINNINNIYNNNNGAIPKNSRHNHQDSPHVQHANIYKSMSPARRNLFSCPEESELDQSFSSSLKISTLQRFLSADQTRNSRSDGWKNIFKPSQKVKSVKSSSVISEPISTCLENSFEQSNSFSNVKLTPVKKEGAFVRTSEPRTSGGLFNSLSRIFKRNKRKSESGLKDANNNTLPLKRVHLRNASQGSLRDVRQHSHVSRSRSETTLQYLNAVSFNNGTQERLETEAFHADKHSLTSCRVALLSSKYSGASCMRQSLVDFNRWNSLLFTLSSLLPPNKILSNEDFVAKRSAFKRSAKTLVINIKNTLINYHSGSFVDCVRLSCCISYADVVSCCSFVLDFVSLPSDRKRITDSVTAVGRTFHATVSSSPAYHEVYNKNEVFDDKKSKKLSENVQKVIDNSKNLAFLIDSIRFNQLTMKF